MEPCPRPSSAHAGKIEADRNLLRGHNAVLLRQILVTRDILHALSHQLYKGNYQLYKGTGLQQNQETYRLNHINYPV